LTWKKIKKIAEGGNGIVYEVAALYPELMTMKGRTEIGRKNKEVYCT